MSTAVSMTNRKTSMNSITGGVVIITIADSPVDITYGSSLPCRTCLVAQQSGTQAYMNIDAAATTSTWKMSTTPIEVPIDDVNKLHFIGTAADKIQILWRN